jgi:hypothetical protein
MPQTASRHIISVRNCRRTQISFTLQQAALDVFFTELISSLKHKYACESTTVIDSICPNVGIHPRCEPTIFCYRLATISWKTAISIVRWSVQIYIIHPRTNRLPRWKPHMIPAAGKACRRTLLRLTQRSCWSLRGVLKGFQMFIFVNWHRFFRVNLPKVRRIKLFVFLIHQYGISPPFASITA